MRTILKTLVILATVFALNSCDSEESIQLSTYTLKVTLPESELQGVDLTGLSVELKNTQSGTSQTLITNSSGQISFTGLPGVYNLIVTGKKTYSFVNTNGETITNTVEVAGYKENVLLSANTEEQVIEAFIKIENKGWVIKELYFTGVKTPSGGNYNKDQFVEIYNNTNEVMYADGICIAQTANNTQSAAINIYGSDIETNTYVNTVYTIPGNGTDVKVEPGKSILIAPQPINHKESNVNSFDLSMANYQWYDKSTITIDVPEVPNLDRYYSYSSTVWLLHVNGYVSFLIFKLPEDYKKGIDAFVEENTDKRLNNNGKETIAIRVPNSYVLDAVELGSKSDFKSKSFSSSLDIGYTYCNASGTGKSVRRKVQSVDNGRVIYKDTNNSALDFISNADPKPKVFQAD